MLPPPTTIASWTPARRDPRGLAGDPADLLDADAPLARAGRSSRPESLSRTRRKTGRAGAVTRESMNQILVGDSRTGGCNASLRRVDARFKTPAT